MGYEECLVLTNDLWKHRAGGIPKHCFLIATAMRPGRAPEAPDDEEVVLLRVIGPAPMPEESELVAVRAEAMRAIVTESGQEAAAAPGAILDVLTRNEIQFSALRAKIIGTFYEAVVDGEPLLSFGSDIETFYSASRYLVYKPLDDSLSIIASYPEITEAEFRRQKEEGKAPARLRLGVVRYTSTRGRRQADPNTKPTTAVPVNVNIEDFISMKTALFGMTRMGKSNTMKTLAIAIFQHAKETRQKIGQLLFDPAGEYANLNVQDQTALSQIGEDHVTVFKFGATEDEPGRRSLGTNFFGDVTIDVTWSIISTYLSQGPSGRANYVQDFLAANVLGPDDFQDNPSEWKRARRRRAALYAALLRAGFQPPAGWSVQFAANANVVQAVNAELQQRGKNAVASDSHGNIRLGADKLEAWIDALLEARRAHNFPADWIDTQMDAILTVYAGTRGTGYRLLAPLRVYHSPTKTQDYADQVLAELVAGKIVIVDLSQGSESVLKFISERIIIHVVNDAAQRFAQGKAPHNLQIYIEEAHRLFGRDRFAQAAEADPYVRLAKEAAKFKIGLIYATQEVTSVDSIILSNTSNWVVTHLNNTIEVKELSKYYDFQDFAELTLKAEDVGFARLKTRSGRYIIPVQIDLFSAALIDAARAAAAKAAASCGEAH